MIVTTHKARLYKQYALQQQAIYSKKKTFAVYTAKGNRFMFDAAYAAVFSAGASSFFLWNKILSTGKYRKNWTAEQIMVEALAARSSFQLSFSINRSLSVVFFARKKQKATPPIGGMVVLWDYSIAMLLRSGSFF